MNKEIKCPQCGTVMQIGEETYDSLARQVRDNEFLNEVNETKDKLRESYDSAIQAAISKKEIELKDLLSQKDSKILELTNEVNDVKSKSRTFFEGRESKHKDQLAEKDCKIAELLKEIQMNEETCANAVAEAVMKNEAKILSERMSAASKIATLTEKLDNANKYRASEVARIDSEHQKEVADLKAIISKKETERIANEKALTDKYDVLIKTKDEEIEYYKNYKTKSTVKLLGESLEEHCVVEYEKVRSFMPNALFEKDNKVSPSGSKGDFIFRDFEDGEEFVSIMFDMKNEADDSKYKHKNEDHLAKLDKDRREKGCEYAVLVSMLETDSDLYNQGIVDVSHKYPKMFVVRPQFFIPIIRLIRDSAKDKIGLKHQIDVLKHQSLDVTNFEQNLEDFKSAIEKSVDLASKKRTTAIQRIDKAIEVLQQVKDDLIQFEKHMESVGKKSEKVTAKKLTKNAPTVANLIWGPQTESEAS